MDCGQQTTICTLRTGVPYIYWSDGVLFHSHDDNYTGESIAVKEPAGFEPPTLTSSPPLSGDFGIPLTYLAQAEGTTPFWWSLFESPTGARINHETGELVATYPNGERIHLPSWSKTITQLRSRSYMKSQ